MLSWRDQFKVLPLRRCVLGTARGEPLEPALEEAAEDAADMDRLAFMRAKRCTLEVARPLCSSSGPSSRMESSCTDVASVRNVL